MCCCSASDPSWIDGGLYPDTEPPVALDSLADQVDFVARLCAAWDFGRLPDPDVVAEIRRPAWREAVDACRLLTSPVYHLLRQWHGLPPLPFLGQQLAYIRDDPNLAYI
ncbi:MAG: hypothetical protein ACE5NP_10955 [Anaerolineae bacterium]